MNLSEIPERFQKFGKTVPAGVGTQGVVYRFPENEKVVMKVIDCTEEIQYQSVLHEIEIMDCLANCSGVVHLLDYEIVKESDCRKAYLLLECAKSLLASGILTELSAKKAVHLCMQLCDVLIECRCCGILHLDIKPQNLFLDAQGKVQLGDFGVSLYQNELQENKLLRGSLNYVAPEVYRNRTNSELSEIYSVGMVLYWLLNSQKLPFEQELFSNKETSLYKRLAGTEFSKIPVEDIGIGDALERTFQTVCAFEPGDRPQSFEELRDLLCCLYEIVPDKSITRNSPVRLPGVMPVPMPATVGTAYTEGMGVDGDLKKATEWYTKAADKGNATALEFFSQRYSMQDADEFSATVALTGQMPQDNAAASEVIPPISKVQFSAVAPKVFAKGAYTMVEIVMYEEQYRSVVDGILANMTQPAQEKKSGMIAVAEHSNVRIVLTSPDVEIEDNEERGKWNGEYLDFSFAIFLPEKYSKGQVLFLATVYINDLPVTRLKFIVQCQSMCEQRPDVTRQDVLSAFISYASQDRSKVIAIIQGMKKIQPEMDLFFDVDNLQSGENWESALYREIENRDVLFLCWSHFAKESKWVEMEWRYALENKGADCIEPIPIEPPSVCPPPKELEQKHFNDRLLYLAKMS